MLQWERVRDPNTCEVYHRLYDPSKDRFVAFINKEGYYYLGRIGAQNPILSKKVHVLKKSIQKIYEDLHI